MGKPGILQALGSIGRIYGCSHCIDLLLLQFNYSFELEHKIIELQSEQKWSWILCAAHAWPRPSAI